MLRNSTLISKARLLASLVAALGIAATISLSVQQYYHRNYSATASDDALQTIEDSTLSADDFISHNATAFSDPWSPIQLTESMLTSGQYFVYKFLGSAGVGSNLMNLFGQVIYLGELLERSPIVQTAHYPYRRNATHGLLTGYFTPGFPVIDDTEQYALVERFTGNMSLSIEEGDVDGWLAVSPTYRKNVTAWLTCTQSFRHQVQDAYNHQPDLFYDKVVRYACPHLRFNDETKEGIRQLRRDKGLDLDFGASNATSVAFHIRRTDKRRETKETSAAMYVEKMLRVIPETPVVCYVATDDVSAVVQMELALQKAHVACTVHALQASKQWRQQRTRNDSTLLLMADLDIIAESTYFIGTFSSNLGDLAAVLRGCRRRDRTHFAYSYDVHDNDFTLW